MGSRINETNRSITELEDSMNICGLYSFHHKEYSSPARMQLEIIASLVTRHFVYAVVLVAVVSGSMRIPLKGFLFN